MCRHAVSSHTNGEYTAEHKAVPVPQKEISSIELIQIFIGKCFGLVDIIQQGLEVNTSTGDKVDTSEQP
jgi:hypothetical protein